MGLVPGFPAYLSGPSSEGGAGVGVSSSLPGLLAWCPQTWGQVSCLSLPSSQMNGASWPNPPVSGSRLLPEGTLIWKE